MEFVYDIITGALSAAGSIVGVGGGVVGAVGEGVGTGEEIVGPTVGFEVSVGDATFPECDETKPVNPMTTAATMRTTQMTVSGFRFGESCIEPIAATTPATPTMTATQSVLIPLHQLDVRHIIAASTCLCSGGASVEARLHSAY